MIKTVIRLKDGAVMVFDAEGEQIIKYQGQYEKVKSRILRDAPPETLFAHWVDNSPEPEMVGRENW